MDAKNGFSHWTIEYDGGQVVLLPDFWDAWRNWFTHGGDLYWKDIRIMHSQQC